MLPADASWNGATLAERLAHVRGDGGRTPFTRDIAEGSTTPGEEVLAPWARACTLGDMEALFRRLSWDGIEPDAARAATAARTPHHFPVAPWVDRMLEFVAEARACATMVGGPEWDEELARVGSSAPFADAWMPVLRFARRRLTRTVAAYRNWVSDESERALEDHLVKELARLGELALLEDYRAQTHAAPSASGEGYEAYVRRLLASRYGDLFETYPVLARHAVLLADQWVDHIAVLVSRLQEDQATIEATFGSAAGQILRLTPGLSDRHAGGCRVAAVEFASGLRLAYKPRDVRLERVFNEWLMWLRDAGLDGPPPLRVVDRGTHGWVEWVEQADLGSIKTVHAYFRSAGALVCLTHVLGATDLHSENLIASSRGPVLVDTEMLLQPSTRRLLADTLGDDASVGASSDSCLASGLVSLIVVDRSGKAFDVGGLQPAASRELVVPMREWHNLRRDDIGFVPQRRAHPTLRNDVRLNGEVQRPQDFVDDLCAGFESTYRFLESKSAVLLAPDGPLGGFAGCRTRLLFRPSDEYSAAQYLLAAPRYQRRGLDRSLAIEVFARVFIGEVERPRLWPLVHDGRPALESLDIPRLTVQATATDLEASTGEVVESLYAQSGMEAMRSRLAALSEEDLTCQIDQLRTALERAGVAPLAHREDMDDLRATAEWIGSTLLGRAHQESDGSLRWPSSRGRIDLYSGASGIALFFAALAAVTGRDRWCDSARRALRGIEADTGEPPDSSAWRIGICSGRASVAYALALAGYLLGDAPTIGRAGELASSIPFDAIDADVVLDVEGGAAGALLGLLAVHHATSDDRLIAMASRCVSRLASTQIRSGNHRGAWAAGERSRPLPGFAHGAAGIAYALSRWATHAADSGAFDAIRQAWEFERRILAENGGAWPAVRRDGGRLVMAAWCYGAPGLALARAAAPAGINDAIVASEIETAMRQTLSEPAAPLDHLCCGNLGRADVALTVGLWKNAVPWIDGGLSMTKTVAARILSQGRLGMRGRGFRCGAPAPEFFQGLAGIGYQLLRSSSPSILPSVLAFETPPAARRPLS